MSDAISIPDVLSSLSGPWQPADVVRVNDAIVRVARLEGEFPWHVHDEDELFLCWDGAFVIELEGAEPVAMSAGDVLVVPKGRRHRPIAEGTAHAILLSAAKQHRLFCSEAAEEFVTAERSEAASALLQRSC